MGSPSVAATPASTLVAATKKMKKKKMQSSLVPPTLPLLTAEVGWPVVGSVHGD